MAVDEALLVSAADQGIGTLRFYQWSEPTLSLGYFQEAGDRKHHEASRNCIVVRRSSGGGAILHDREVTYSLALPKDYPLAKDADRLYDRVHDELMAVLSELLSNDSQTRVSLCNSPLPTANEPFLCFERRTNGDVLIQGKESRDLAWKIAGSAQRRRRGAVLQHGSVLLEMSPSAPELPGIAEIAGISINPVGLVEKMTNRLDLALDLQLEPSSLTRQERSLAERTEAERFASPAWTNRR
jgi:lipoyl(octanoyl) transferase